MATLPEAEALTRILDALDDLRAVLASLVARLDGGRS